MSAVADLSERRQENEYICGDRLAQVKPGKYDLAFIKYEIRTLHGRDPKVVIWFRIVTPGEAHGVVVAKYYNARRSPKTDFKAGPKTDFARDFFEVFGYLPNRWDRWPMSKFKGTVIEGRVRTVTTGRDKRGNKRRQLPEALQYSVVDYLSNLKAGGS